MLFFAWNSSQTFEDLEAKRSVMIYRVKTTHQLFISIAFCIFRNGWIDCRDAFHVDYPCFLIFYNYNLYRL